MSERVVCEKCGIQRPSDSPFGLCPSCLLKAGLDGVTISFGPATSSVLASFGEAFGNIPPVLLRDPDSVTHPDPIVRPTADAFADSKNRLPRLQMFGEIARGGMGAVLKGRDADLGRELAVKVLLESHKDKPEMVRRFVEEAQIAGQLQHPGIVPVYELGALGDQRPYFAMKLVKGETLAAVLSKRKPSRDGLPRLLSILESICQTMAYAHARGVIHRDLKPSNVMVGSFGEVQVMDWGLAKVLPHGGVTDDATAGRTKDEATVIATARSASDVDASLVGSIMGTPAYMAPEQARGEVDQLDQRVDVFAIGSIFCEMLTGQPAFLGRNSGEIQRKAARGDLRDALARLDTLEQDYGKELTDLAKACLAVEPEDRPRNAGEVAQRLGDYQARVQTRLRQSEIDVAAEKARSEEATKRASVERDRRRLATTLAASILGFVLLGGGGWAYFAQQRLIRQATTEQAVNKSLSEATLLRGEAKAAPVGGLTKWAEALAAAKRAEASLQTGEPSEVLRQRVSDLIQSLEIEQADANKLSIENEKDRKLFARIEAIRVQFVEADDVFQDRDTIKIDADRAYAEAFREFGIDIDQVETTEAASKLRQCSQQLDVAWAIDAWALNRKFISFDSSSGYWIAERVRQAQRLFDLAAAIDPDPWRCAIRNCTRSDGYREALGLPPANVSDSNYSKIRTLLQNEIELARQPARALYVIGLMVEHSREAWSDATLRFVSERVISPSLYKRAWQLGPNDFQICWFLSVRSQYPAERRAFELAAAAAAPKSKFARQLDFLGTEATVGEALLSKIILVSKGEQAPDWTFHNLIIDTPEGGKLYMGPTRYAPLRKNDVVFELDEKDQFSNTVDQLRWSITLQPTVIELRERLAKLLVRLGRYDEAMMECNEIVKRGARQHVGEIIGSELYGMGQLEQARRLLEDAVERIGGSDQIFSEFYPLLGAIYFELGKRDDAVKAIERSFLQEATIEGVPVTIINDRWRHLWECTAKKDEVISVYRAIISGTRPSRDTSYVEAYVSGFQAAGKVETFAQLQCARELLECVRCLIISRNFSLNLTKWTRRLRSTGRR